MGAPFYEVGRYACKVTNQAMGEARTGNVQFILQFTVLGKVDPADPTRFIPAPAQYQRTLFRTITEKTIPYFMEDLKALGFTGSSFKELDPTTPNFHDFRDADVDMWCAHENDQEGKPREKWGVARQGSTIDTKPVEPKKMRDLDNLFGKHLKTLKPAAVPTRTAPVNAAQPEDWKASDDDAPF